MVCYIHPALTPPPLFPWPFADVMVIDLPTSCNDRCMDLTTIVTDKGLSMITESDYARVGRIWSSFDAYFWSILVF